MEIGKTKKGTCILYNEKPYRIKDVRNVVVSTHSHTRTKVELEDVFTGVPLSLNLSPHEHVREVLARVRGDLFHAAHVPYLLFDGDGHISFVILARSARIERLYLGVIEADVGKGLFARKEGGNDAQDEHKEREEIMAPQYITFHLNIPFKVKKRKNWILASCPSLDIHSQGPTEKKALNSLREAISLFLISCFERGTLDAVLKECGFSTYKEPPPKQPKTKTASRCIDVPIPLMLNPTHSTRSCHV